MTATASNPGRDRVDERSLVTYRRLLALYPKSFREQYGPDMEQLFGDLVMQAGHDGGSRVWSRVLRDLGVSVPREHLAHLRGPGRRRVSPWLALAVALFVGLSLVLGNPVLLPIGVFIFSPWLGVVLFVLPAIGLFQLRRAWVVWRTTSVRPVLRTLVAGGCFVPGIWWFVAVGGAYWTGVAIVLALIYVLGGGAIWAVVTLYRTRGDEHARRRRVQAVGLILAAVVVLGGMAGAGFNSYLNARKPPGDHSARNASEETRMLWDASISGDVETTVAMIAACADPFVEFAGGHGSRARTNAEWYAGVKWGNTDPAPEPARSRYFEIIDLLSAAENSWTERCNS